MNRTDDFFARQHGIDAIDDSTEDTTEDSTEDATDDTADAAAGDADAMGRHPSHTEVLIAATLALMTGVVERAALTQPLADHGQSLLMATKVRAHLHSLSCQPQMSPGLRETLARLRLHWDRLAGAAPLHASREAHAVVVAVAGAQAAQHPDAGAVAHGARGSVTDRLLWLRAPTMLQ